MTDIAALADPHPQWAAPRFPDLGNLTERLTVAEGSKILFLAFDLDAITFANYHRPTLELECLVIN